MLTRLSIILSEMCMAFYIYLNELNYIVSWQKTMLSCCQILESGRLTNAKLCYIKKDNGKKKYKGKVSPK